MRRSAGRRFRRRVQPDRGEDRSAQVRRRAHRRTARHVDEEHRPGRVDQRFANEGVRTVPGTDLLAADYAPGHVIEERGHGHVGWRTSIDVRELARELNEPIGLQAQVGDPLVRVGVVHRAHLVNLGWASIGRAPKSMADSGRRSGTSARRSRRLANARRVRDFTVPIGMARCSAISDWLRPRS